MSEQSGVVETIGVVDEGDACVVVDGGGNVVDVVEEGLVGTVGLDCEAVCVEDIAKHTPQYFGQ